MNVQRLLGIRDAFEMFFSLKVCNILIFWEHFEMLIILFFAVIFTFFEMIEEFS